MRTENKTHWLRTTILVLLACAIVGLALSAVLFFRDPGPASASATLVLTFDGAASGTAPNGVSFDLRALDSDEVLSDGLKAAGLEGVYTPEQIRSCLAVRGVYPDAMADQVMYYESLLNFTSSRELTVGNYHPTTFQITLSREFDESISREQLTALLRSITEAYRAYFARVYAYGMDAGNSFFELEDYDYPQQLDIIEGRFSAVADYAQELYRKTPAFLYRGTSFNDVYVRLNMLLDSSITKLNANLTINGLTKNPERLLTQYRYQILDLSIRRDMQNQELAKLDQLIASYEKNETIYLSTSESLTKIDGNSSATYDALVNKRKSVADGVTELGSRITNYNLRINDLLTSTGAIRPAEAEAIQTMEDPEGTGAPASAGSLTPEEIAEAERRLKSQRAALEESISTLVADGEAVVADFREMLENYNAQQINELTFTVTELTFHAPRLVSGAFIKQAIRTAGPIVALGFIVCMALIVISRKKEERDS
jgi:hypothetical protein